MRMQQMVPNIFPHTPPPLATHTLGMGSIGLNSTFSEHGHVKLKGITKCSNMVANIFSADPPTPSDPGEGSIGQNSTFLEHGHVAY